MTELYEHQKRAVEKLRHVKVGALYMDMGTGKTRTALELAMIRKRANKIDCILWLCPVSVKKTIEFEVKKHSDLVPEIVSSKGIKNWRADVYIAGIESLSSSIMLNYYLLALVKKRRCFIVCDESSMIKNFFAKRTKNILRIAEHCKYRLILNGTPISNNEADLFAQWYFLDPRILGYNSFYSFAANHLEFDPNNPWRIVRAHDTDVLTRKIQPFVYQVKKSECLDLPAKWYSSRYCDMTDRQRGIYIDTKEKILNSMFECPDWYEQSTMVYRLFSGLQKVTSGLTLDGKPIFKNANDNPRIRVLLSTIDKLPKDAKCIIWCKYTHEILTIKELLGDDAVCFYGDISQKNRQKNLEEFRNSKRFLIANKSCGAFGINLQFCQYAIYYENDFNWATRSQSEDRIHRVGQTHNVEYIDICCDNSIDSRIQSCLSRKTGIVEEFQNNIDILKDKENLRRWIDGADIIRAKPKSKAKRNQQVCVKTQH